VVASLIDTGHGDHARVGRGIIDTHTRGVSNAGYHDNVVIDSICDCGSQQVIVCVVPL
jgi:hypothetical protein